MVGMMILFALMLTGLTGVIINPIRAFVERML
jgi:hypothetical protein